MYSTNIISEEDLLKLTQGMGIPERPNNPLDIIVPEIKAMLGNVVAFEDRNPTTLSDADAQLFGADVADHFQYKWSTSAVYAGRQCLCFGDINPDPRVSKVLGKSLGGQSQYSFVLLRQFLLHVDNHNPLGVRDEFVLTYISLRDGRDCICRRLAAELTESDLYALCEAHKGDFPLFTLH